MSRRCVWIFFRLAYFYIYRYLLCFLDLFFRGFLVFIIGVEGVGREV